MGAARILLVDDSESVRETLATTLSFKGYEVAQASSAEAALEIMADREFDLVFCDLAMPAWAGGA